MLELKNIIKSYKVGETKQVVLKGIDIKFRENEFTSILGTSGSGKTTLLNIIGGLDRYDSGDLIIDGISTKKYTSNNWDSYRNYRVGFIFQSYNLIMHQSVLQNVEISLTLSGISKSDRKKKAIEALKRVGLEEHIYKRPNQLSGGQMQRVAIARALINDPDIILADEPTGALDSKTSIQIMDILKEIAKDKLVIMVTHNPDLAKKYSTRIIELKDGVIVDDSNPCNEEDKENKNDKKKRTSMSIFSALNLSFNNLLTKKGRTFLTAFAGSIGIIGIALILSLSNGVNNYAKSMERESLEDYPITIEKNNIDIFSAISKSLSASDEKVKCNKNEICSKDNVIFNSIDSITSGLLNKNDTREFKKYIEKYQDTFDKYADSIVYGYDFDLNVYTKNYNKVNPSEILGSSDELFKEIEDKKFKLISGKNITNDNELVLVIGKDNTISDSVLYSLGIKSQEDLLKEMMNKAKNEGYKVKSTKYKYDDFIGKTYKLVLNTDYYQEKNDAFIDASNDKEYMKKIIDNSEDLKIVGIVKNKDSNDSYVGYNHGLIISVVDKVSKTKIYKKQINNKEVNVLTGKEFDGINKTYEDNQKLLAIYEIDEPSSINIYSKDYKSKQEIIKLIDKYNKEHNEKIEYTDLMKTLISGITKVVNIVSYVLIGFVAISLIVSSIMIAIITYISVLERTKEIGILRAIGASKKDIKRVFKAETIIEGFVAGTLGVLIALLIGSVINVAVYEIGKIKHIASLPLSSAIILILLSVLLNVIAGLKPASMAAKKDPVEALRTE